MDGNSSERRLQVSAQRRARLERRLKKRRWRRWWERRWKRRRKSRKREGKRWYCVVEKMKPSVGLGEEKRNDTDLVITGMACLLVY
jgi:hypothetical protein